jgi:hypothetical protein
MDERTFYAGLAMAALLVRNDQDVWPFDIDPIRGDPNETYTDHMARAAYIYADAMLRTRNRNA